MRRIVVIHAFNKSGRHLEFSMNDVIRGKNIHVAKMATKDESSVDVDFAACSCKKECSCKKRIKVLAESSLLTSTDRAELLPR